MEPKYGLLEEWVFTAEDKDNGDTVTDVHLVLIALKKSKETLLEIIPDINVRSARIGQALEKYVNEKHPICSITGNRWEIVEFSPSGKRMIETTTREVLSIREKEAEYPIMNMS